MNRSASHFSFLVLQAVLRRRDNIQAELEAKNEALAAKRADRDADPRERGVVWQSLMGKNPEEARQLKQQRLAGEIHELKEEIDKLEDRVEWANNALKGDWSRWQKSMRSDLKDAFLTTAEKNIDHYEKCLAVWESFLLSMRAEVGDISQPTGDS